MNDSLPVQAIPVTGTPDPVAAALHAAAREAMASHKADCPARAAGNRCETCQALTAEWRRTLRECGQAAATAGGGQ